MNPMAVSMIPNSIGAMNQMCLVPLWTFNASPFNEDVCMIRQASRKKSVTANLTLDGDESLQVV